MTTMGENTPDDSEPAIDEAAVRRTAYFMWENDGYPEGKAEEYWQRALEAHRHTARHDVELQREPPPRDGAG
jgi:hypothetical protein